MIRKMILKDFDEVVAIDQASFSLPWPPRSFQFELAENSASRAWVIEVNYKIVAMIVSWFIIDELHIATIATHPEHRQQGFGKKILLHALQAAREEGAVRAFLEVRAGNPPAIRLYESFGFVEDGRKKEYYKDNNEDAVLMSLNDLSRLHGE